ncbi:chromosome segregation SMC family protein [Sphingomonas sp. Leaf257]|uniref:chromosome segregation SMC family protein n=1 Tax=Sphingomonas sp. Leaf257 TaxID=1736309 RepID=UPI0006F71A05|nr:AAA family ATPase [Sphingomonas sp. Leaf257]KQO58761.1 chromosome segregation protein [Sphingomonas sp. Leaf257]
MQIKRLRISGFKSFVDPADLVIEPGLTGVVGPNGCGKSNLLEALRWTMGENSARSMRGAGMEDVIFAGTATRPPRDFAEVTILAEREGDETEIVRRIERGAGSAYRIDGRDVRAKDVALLFADAATGAHSPALVSQNRIGAVIAAKPAERRAMLEEAAGIAGLHVRRRDAETKLRATETNLTRLDEAIADQDARIATLRRQARAAERYRLLSDQIRVAEARMIFARWRDAAEAAGAAKIEAEAAERRVTETTAAEREAAAAQEQAVARAARTRAASLAARDTLSEAGHALSRTRDRRHGLQRRIEELAAARTRIDEDRAREDALAHDAAAAIRRLAEECEDLEARIAHAVQAMPRLDALLAEAETKNRNAEVALARALSAQAAEAAERRIAEAALTAARARHARAERDARAVASAIEALPDMAEQEAAREAAIATQAAAKVDADKARAALGWAEESELTATGERDSAEGARARAIAALAALEAEAATLTRATASKGGDRLLDEVQAEPGFERALAAALGDELETPLVDWHGSPVAPDDPAAPVGTLRLGERIKAPPTLARRLSQIFLVEADSGQHLSVGQRLVTREGRLRRWDGYIGEGGGAAAAERMERRNRLAALEAERPAAEAAVQTATEARAAIEDRIARARAAAASARNLHATAEASLRDAQRAEDRAQAVIERLSAQRTDLAARAERIAAEMDEALAECDRAQATLAGLPDGTASAAETARLQQETQLARSAVALARSERTTLERSLTQTRDRLSAAMAEAQGWDQRAGQAAGRIAEMDDRAATLDRDAAALADQPSLLAEEIARLAAAHDTAKAEAERTQIEEADAERALRAIEAAHAETHALLSAAREARAGALARVENHELRRVELGRVSGERFACPAPVLPEKLAFDSASVGSPQAEAAAHDKLSADRERIGPVNLVAEQELADLEASGAASAAEREDLVQAVARLRSSIGLLNREGRQRLLEAFEAVNGHFQTLFATLFDGGSAHLALIDSDDPLEAGLEIMAQPPGKRLQSLTLLSGGEQALTAVALIFGLFLTNPAPICVLDEVDAPLDDANIDRFCGLLDRMTRETDTRYLIVTHNAVTMSRMHRLFGVTMIERGVSRLVSVDLQAAETLLAAE